MRGREREREPKGLNGEIERRGRAEKKKRKISARSTMESRFSFLPCGRSVQPYRHRRKSPYTAAMCRRRKDKKGDRSKRGGRRRRRRKGKRRWIGPRDASMHRGARGRASEGGERAARWAEEEVDGREEKESPSIAPEGDGQAATTGR